jgi:hypothetical protein
MDRVKTVTLLEVNQYFSDELKVVMEKHSIVAQETSLQYLASLLSRHLESKNFFHEGPDGKLSDYFLGELYGQYLKASGEEQKLLLQRLGDVCLLLSGFFAESIQRKVVDIGYYFGMGGSAYAQLSELVHTEVPRAMYSELADKFEPFSNVLGEMSERSGLQSNKDVLRLYERWTHTGSDRLKNLLQEQGIAIPLHGTLKLKH